MRTKTLTALMLGALLTVAVPPAPAMAAGDANPAPAPQGAPDGAACGLITRAEIEALQGARLVQAKGSDSAQGGFIVSQCFYQLEEFPRSVSLTLTRGDESAPGAARDRWNEIFHDGAGDGAVKESRAQTGKEARTDAAKEKKEGRPRRVDDVGDEAFWSGNAQVGALYILEGDVYIRLSVGGGEPEQARIERSRALARKALRRL